MTENSNILQDEYNRLDAVAEASSSISSDENMGSDKVENCAAIEEEKKQHSQPKSSGTTSKKSKKASFALKMRLPTVSVVKNTLDEKLMADLTANQDSDDDQTNQRQPEAEIKR